jgi:hypothetical protein
MANYNDNAFNSMNNSAGGDMYITGGAITLSEYEQNMNPDDQSEYENTLMELFHTAYQGDPIMARYPNVSFKHWLTTIDGDDWREGALDYAEMRRKGEGGDFTYMGDGGIVQAYAPPPGYERDEQIYLLQRLAHLHTGRIEDLIDIVESGVQEVPVTLQDMPGSAPMQGPEKAIGAPRSVYEGGGDQGPF